MSEMKAIFAPSGDQRACLSCAPEERVRLRVGPFSMGHGEDVAAGHEQRPLALRAELEVLDVLVGRGDATGAGETPSSGTVMEIARSAPDEMSSTCSSPFELVDDAAGAVVARPAHVPLVLFGELPVAARAGSRA
jgi:hypothetical protein